MHRGLSALLITELEHLSIFIHVKKLPPALFLTTLTYSGKEETYPPTFSLGHGSYQWTCFCTFNSLKQDQQCITKWCPLSPSPLTISSTQVHFSKGPRLYLPTPAHPILLSIPVLMTAGCSTRSFFPRGASNYLVLPIQITWSTYQEPVIRKLFSIFESQAAPCKKDGTFKCLIVFLLITCILFLWLFPLLVRAENSCSVFNTICTHLLFSLAPPL